MSIEDLFQLILLSATLIMTVLGWHVSKINKEDIVRLENRLVAMRERSGLLFKRKVEIADDFLNCVENGLQIRIKLEVLNNRVEELEKKMEEETDKLSKESYYKVLEQYKNNILEEATTLNEWVGNYRFNKTRISCFDEFNETEILNLFNGFIEKIGWFFDVSYKELDSIDILKEISSDYLKIFKIITEKLEV